MSGVWHGSVRGGTPPLRQPLVKQRILSCAPPDGNAAAWEQVLRNDEEQDDMARKARGGETKQLAIRIPVEMAERLERHAERLAAQYPGALGAIVSDAIRALLAEGLDRAEAAEAKGRRR